jgi:hypothetical protein
MTLEIDDEEPSSQGAATAMQLLTKTKEHAELAKSHVHEGASCYTQAHEAIRQAKEFATKVQKCGNDTQISEAMSALAYIRQREDAAIAKKLSSTVSSRPANFDVLLYVGARLNRLRTFFPLATAKQLCDSLQYYSPESNLIDVLGYKPVLPIADSGQKWVPGKLEYGSDQTFHGGVERVIGVALSSSVKPGETCSTCGHIKSTAGAGHTVEHEILENGQDDDKYNLWYFKYCPAREQKSYDEKGVLRQYDATGKSKVLDEGHTGMRLADFVSKINSLLKEAESTGTVLDEEVLTLRHVQELQ